MTIIIIIIISSSSSITSLSISYSNSSAHLLECKNQQNLTRCMHFSTNKNQTAAKDEEDNLESQEGVQHLHHTQVSGQGRLLHGHRERLVH